ncbi:choice-of-anchor D domain-containing protein [Geminisphaera colitermitum]|uniref:RCC1 domain-containing protein n=1 Tax=Geminisphaera colitermitum TaxID=1148786 RepID=UPI000158C65D|nr:choice-of-anchor D domain-containing protein [Geminisphaera colitermitum]
MNTKISTNRVLAVLPLLLLFASTAVAIAASAISLSGDLSFGNVIVDQTTTRTLTIRNTGSTSLAIYSITYPNGCFSGDWSSGTIAAGGTRNVTITFTPTAAQSYGGNITIVSNAASGTNTQEVSGSGIAFALSGDLFFSNVLVGQTATRKLTISNTGNTSFEVMNITYPVGFSGNWSSGTIDAGETRNVTVSFVPAATQRHEGNVTVVTNAVGGTKTRSVFGNGIPAAGSSIVAVSAGNHSLFLSSNGIVWGSGWNDGQLGDGTTTHRSIPVQITSDGVAISASLGHSLFLRNDGTAWASGSNYYGQLGDGTKIDSHTPVQIMTDVAAVSVGAWHSLFLKVDGTAWASGYNYLGRLGDGTTTNRSTPVQVMRDVAAISGGGSHSLFLKSDGTAWATGYNGSGQLGNGTTTNRSTPVQVMRDVVAISAGSSHSLFLKSDGTAWATGYNSSGQLGNGTTTNCSTPVQVMRDVVAISAGSSHSLFLKRDGSVWACGSNEYGQLGDGTTDNRTTPVQVMNKATGISAGNQHSLFQRSDGTAWASGSNGSGALGDGTTIPRRSAVRSDIEATRIVAFSGNLSFGNVTVGQAAVRVLEITNVSASTLNVTGIIYPSGITGDWNGQIIPRGETEIVTVMFKPTAAQSYGGDVAIRVNHSGDTDTRSVSGIGIAAENAPDVVVVSAGSSSSFFLKADGTAWASGSASGMTIPVQIMNDMVAVSDNSHSLFLKNDGTVWASGSNGFGQLGDGTRTNRSTPVQVMDGAASISAGGNHSLFLKADGTVWASGYNSDGQLGDGTKTDRDTPVQVMSDVTAVSAGYSHSLFLKRDGTVWAVGSNNFGQLGDGTKTDRSTPVQTMSGVMAISAGDSHSLFLKRDGTVWASGINESGRLGDGTTTNRSTPVQIMGNVAAISAGGSHSLFLKADGTVWTTGWTFENYAPVHIMSEVTAISAGTSHSLYLKNDGSAWASGYNYYGQLGDGTRTKRDEPVQAIAPVPTRVIALSGDLSFDSVIVGQTATQTLTISNTGTAFLTVTGISFPSGFSGDWNSGTITAGGTQAVTVSFKPTAALSYSGKVTILSDATSGTNTCVVSGIGTTFSVFPVIMTQPVSQNKWQGESATFSVSATGQGTLSYQWYFNGKAIKGATGSSYTIAKVVAKNAGNYTVTVKNANGTATSDAASLTVNVPQKPKVTSKPTSKMETGLGKSVTLSVTATGNPPPTFQWLLNGNPISGATGATCTIENVGEQNLGSYSVVVTSGPNTITSKVTTLSAILPPVIETPAAGESDFTYALATKGAKLTVKLAKNKAKPTYQWLLDGNPIPGATKASYTAKTDGQYSVRVTNGAGTVERVIANVKLIVPPKFDAKAGLIADRTEIVADVGQSVTFTAKLAEGTGPFTWTWLDGKTVLKTHMSSSLTDTFTLTNVAKAQKISVQVESVKDAKGKPLAKAKSKAVVIKIVLPPQIVSLTVKPGEEIAPGKTATLTVKATGTKKLVYEWRGPDGEVIRDARGPVNKASLTLKPASKTATVTAGTYAVRVSNGAGDSYARTASVTIKVQASAATAKTAGISGITALSSTAESTSSGSNAASVTGRLPTAADTLRLTDLITGETSLLDLGDSSRQNLRSEWLVHGTVRVSFDQLSGHAVGEDTIWEAVTLDLTFDGDDSGLYMMTSVRVRVAANGDLVEDPESGTGFGVFELE